MVIGTLGKALGSYGAYVCGSRQLVEYLLNSARPFIFSTALPPAVVAAASAALELIAERPERVERLAANAAVLREGLREEGFEIAGDGTQIVPLVVGGADDAMALCERALERGVFAQAIRPPTVPARDLPPADDARWRPTRPAELRSAARVIGESARELGLAPVAAKLRIAAGHRAPRCPARPEPRARRLRHRHRHRGRQDGRRRGPDPRACGRRAPGPRVQAGRHRPRRVPGGALEAPDWESAAELPDHVLLRLAAGSEQADDEIAPHRYGPAGLAAPRRRAGGRARSTRAGSLQPPARPPRAPSCSSARGSGASSCPLPATTWCATSRASWPCRSWSPPRRAWARSTTRC